MIIPKSTAAISTIFTVIGFILIVVATCSVPVNENLYLFELKGTTSNETTIARVGVLGLCGDFQGRSANGQWTNMHDCAKEGLGFRITTTKEVRVSDNGRIVPVEATIAKKELTRALVFNPLSATFAGIASTLGMFMYAIDTSTCLSLCTYIMLAISTGFGWIAFAINLAITLRSRDRVNEFATSPEQTVSLRIGPTPWISLASAHSNRGLDRKAPTHPTILGHVNSPTAGIQGGYELTGLNTLDWVPRDTRQLAASESCLKGDSDVSEKWF